MCYHINLCVISGFCRDADDNCTLLCRYAAFSGKYSPTFRDNLSVPSWYYHFTLCNSTEEHRSHINLIYKLPEPPNLILLWCEVINAVEKNFQASQNVPPCCLVSSCRRLEGVICLIIQRLAVKEGQWIQVISCTNVVERNDNLLYWKLITQISNQLCKYFILSPSFAVYVEPQDFSAGFTEQLLTWGDQPSIYTRKCCIVVK